MTRLSLLLYIDEAWIGKSDWNIFVIIYIETRMGKGKSAKDTDT